MWCDSPTTIGRLSRHRDRGLRGVAAGADSTAGKYRQTEPIARGAGRVTGPRELVQVMCARVVGPWL